MEQGWNQTRATLVGGEHSTSAPSLDTKSLLYKLYAYAVQN